MEGSIISIDKTELAQNRELKYSNHQYNFKNVLSIPLILDQIFQFMEKADIKRLSLCFKKIYQLYCIQIKKLKIKKDIEESNISNIKFDKYKNLIEIDLSSCKNIKDYSFISNLEKLENLNLDDSNISDISFLEKTKNIKVLNLAGFEKIKDYSYISNLEKLENLNLGYLDVTDISFLKKNKNIKILNLESCKKIKDFSFISNLEKLEILNICNTNISDISFLEKNKNIKTLNIMGCHNIKDYSIVSNLKKTKNIYVDIHLPK